MTPGTYLKIFCITINGGGVWSKSEQFGKQFHELIVTKHAGKVGLRPSEITRQEEEALLIVTAVAAREFAPEVFSKLESMELMNSPVNGLELSQDIFSPANFAHEVTFNMHMIATIIGKGIPVSEVKEQTKRVPELIERHAEEVLSVIDFKNNNPEYNSSDKLKCQRISQFIKDEAFSEVVGSFVVEIAKAHERKAENEVARILRELRSFIDEVNEKSEVHLNKNDPDDVVLALQAALLTDSGREHLEPIIMKMTKLIQSSPELCDPTHGQPFEDCRLICNALDFCCKVDPRELVNLGRPLSKKTDEALSVSAKEFDRIILGAVDKFKEENMSEVFQKALANEQFIEDSKMFFRQWIESLPYSGSETKLEQFGEEFQEVIGKKYVTEFYGKGKKGADEGLDILALSCLAAKEVIPDVLRKFKTLDPDIINHPETANRYITFMFYTIASGFESGIL